MTLNEERDKLMAEFPGCSLSIRAESRFSEYSGESCLEYTVFVHPHGGGLPASGTSRNLAHAISVARHNASPVGPSDPPDIEVTA